MGAEARVLIEKKKKPAKSGRPAKGEMLISSLLSEHKDFRKGADVQANPMDIITLVREGLRGDTIKSVAERVDIQLNEVYRLLHITPRTAQRMMKSHNLDTDISDRIVQLMKIHDKCMEAFEDREKMIRWLKTPNFSLGDQTPLSLLDTTDGIELVTKTLTGLEYGVFA